MRSLTFGSKTVHSKTTSREQAPCHRAWGSGGWWSIGYAIPQGQTGPANSSLSANTAFSQRLGSLNADGTARTKLAEMTCEPSFHNDTEKAQKRWFKIFMETKLQNLCRKQTKKDQLREPGGHSQKCRRKMLIDKALRGSSGQGKLCRVCSNSENYWVDWNESHRKDLLTNMQGASV